MAKSFAENVDTALGKLSKGNGYDSGAIATLAKSIAKRGANLDTDIHAALCAAMVLVGDHGDCNTLGIVLNAMPNSARTATAAAWCAKFAPVTATKNAKSGKWTVKMLPKDERFEVNLSAFRNKPFWLKPETVKGVWSEDDFAKAIAALIKRANDNIGAMSADAKAALADLKVAAVKLPKPDADKPKVDTDADGNIKF